MSALVQHIFLAARFGGEINGWSPVPESFSSSAPRGEDYVLR